MNNLQQVYKEIGEELRLRAYQLRQLAIQMELANQEAADLLTIRRAEAVVNNIGKDK